MQVKQVSELKERLNSEEGYIINLLPDLMKEIGDMLKTLITNSFIVEKQPMQVIKTNQRFCVGLRLLTGNILNIKLNEQSITVSVEYGKRI